MIDQASQEKLQNVSQSIRLNIRAQTFSPL